MNKSNEVIYEKESRKEGTEVEESDRGRKERRDGEKTKRKQGKERMGR